MKTVNRELLDKLANADLPYDDNLCGGAARKAAKELLDNWYDAVSDGTPMSVLLPDVAQVCFILLEWQADLRELFAEEEN